MIVHNTLTLCATGLCIALAGAAQGALAYPDKPITIVIPYGPKSDTAGFAHLLAVAAKKHQPGIEIIEDARAGDSGAKAAAEVHKSAPDGYTLMLGRVGSQAISPAVKPSLPYRWTDFTHLGVIEIDPLVCAVRGNSAFRTARDLTQALRKAPGTLKYGHTGPATIQNLSTQYLLKISGLASNAAEGVTFPGGPEAVVALLDGQLDFVCNNAASMVQPIKEGKMRALFTTAPGRIPELPDVPNAREAGLRDMSSMLGWSVLVGPSGLPPAVVAYWKQILKKVAKDPEWIVSMTERGAIPALGTSKDTEKFIKEQFELYDRLAPTLGLRQ